HLVITHAAGGRAVVGRVVHERRLRGPERTGRPTRIRRPRATVGTLDGGPVDPPAALRGLSRRRAGGGDHQRDVLTDAAAGDRVGVSVAGGRVVGGRSGRGGRAGQAGGGDGCQAALRRREPEVIVGAGRPGSERRGAPSVTAPLPHRPRPQGGARPPLH